MERSIKNEIEENEAKIALRIRQLNEGATRSGLFWLGSIEALHIREKINQLTLRNYDLEIISEFFELHIN